ncbi:MAG: hypothetical protein K2W96_20590 [Gemmataceae bacterium]|nr:hypothetical protein [Gemmataceae bacterium]
MIANTTKALLAAGLLALACGQGARADGTARKAGLVVITNSTKETFTLACTGYLDERGMPQAIKGGAWVFKPGDRGRLTDLGKDFRASRFDFTLETARGKTRWFADRLDAAGNLSVVVDAKLLERHLAQLAPAGARGGPTDEDKKNALGKILGAALAQAIARKEPKDLFEAVIIEAARRARDELVEGALKDLFKGRPAREIRAARHVIGLGLDGKLTVAGLSRAQARDDLHARLKAIDPDIAAGAQMAEFIDSVLRAAPR